MKLYTSLLPQGYGERRTLCITEDTPKDNACHALNRRVEIIKRTGTVVNEKGVTRSIVRGIGGVLEPTIAMETELFYQKEGSGEVNFLREGTTLRSRSDKYFMFFRPLQDCYVYVVQEDSKGNISLLFPDKSDIAHVHAKHDYWVPGPGFGKAYTLDDTKGDEKIYLLATAWEIKSEIEGLSLKEQVSRTIRSVKTRIIKVVKATEEPESIPEEDLKNESKLPSLVERVEGEGGWVRVVRFWHE